MKLNNMKFPLFIHSLLVFIEITRICIDYFPTVIGRITDKYFERKIPSFLHSVRNSLIKATFKYF